MPRDHHYLFGKQALRQSTISGDVAPMSEVKRALAPHVDP
jgi:hypothetical protein